ncbi:MAG: hypothetical protein AAGA03_08530 [Planctomycetota bacterium]
MSWLQMQPSFQVDVPESAEQSIARMRRAIAEDGGGVQVSAAGSVIDFRIPTDQQRFWSPHLSVQISQRDGGSQLFARYSPRPEIWTFFMAIYAMVTTGIIGAGIFAYVQWFLGSTPWSLGLIVLGVLIIAGLHTASLIGQNWSADQIALLREHFDEAVDRAFGHVADQLETPVSSS